MNIKKMDIKINFPLKNYNSFNINVNANEFVQINSVEDLISVEKKYKQKNKLFLGGGSNILFTKNFNGLIVHINLKGIHLEKVDENFVK